MKTLFDKIWEQHVVMSLDYETDLLYVDKHLLHEVSSPQAFNSLINRKLPVFAPSLTLAITDHIVETKKNNIYSQDALAMINALRDNAQKEKIAHFDVDSENQGIVHVTIPDQGYILPGMLVVCGDSHTCTLGALGAIAFGIGTSEVEHVLATQTIRQKKPKNYRIYLTGKLSAYVTVKDVILAIIRKIGVQGGSGYAIEFCGDFIESLPMEGRLTLCNLSIEAGAKCGLVAPDLITFSYLEAREKTIETAWYQLFSDKEAIFDKELHMSVAEITPHVSWGTSVSQSISFTETIPQDESSEKSMAYMNVSAGMKLKEIKLNYIFIGSCTNSRLSDLRVAAEILKGHKIASWITGIVVPGSKKIKQEAEQEGLADIFIQAGFEWRDSGCSLCVSLNSDRIPSGQRCLSTSNRNFEGRQGPGSRTHLASPAVAAASAIQGYIANPQELFL